MRFRGGQTASLSVPIPPKAWQTWQTHPDTVALIDSLLDDHTDAGVAAALNQAGHRSGKGKAFSSHIVLDLRRGYGLPSHYERLRAAGMLTIDEMALPLGVHAGTIKAWRRAGVLTDHLGDDKNRSGACQRFGRARGLPADLLARPDRSALHRGCLTADPSL